MISTVSYAQTVNKQNKFIEEDIIYLLLFFVNELNPNY